MKEQIGCCGKVNPPLRTKADQERLWQALRDGGVTTLGTDHVPSDLATKQNGGKQFGDIWMSRPGLPSGMEHLLPLLLSSVISAGRLDIQALARIGSENTAKLFRLYPRKGTLQPGSDADLVIIDPTIEGQIGRDLYRRVAHECSPYFGYSLLGLPILTMVRGSVVMESGTLVDERSHGRFLRRLKNLDQDSA
jgi:dihydropyrimidinase